MEATTKNTKTHFFASITHGFTGISGFNLWHGDLPNDDGTFPVNLWKPIYRANAHMNGEDVIGTLSNNWGDWEHGKEKTFIKFSTGWFSSDKPNLLGQQYYLSKNKKLVVGYIKNRSFNLHSCAIANTLCSTLYFQHLLYNNYFFNVKNVNWNDPPLGKKLKVKGVVPRRGYKIDFHSSENVILKDFKGTTINGKLKLRYPTLNSNLPVIWFVAKLFEQSNLEQKKLDTIKIKQRIQSNVLSTKEENVSKPILSIFPNPFSNQLKIISTVADIFILQSIEGKVIEKYSINKGVTKLKIHNISIGIYFCHFVYQNKRFKIVKK